MTLQEQQAELAALTETVKAREAWERDNSVRVQWRSKENRGYEPSWCTLTSTPTWAVNFDYRLAPARKTVPLSQEDLPNPCWLKKDGNSVCHIATAASANGLWVESSRMLNWETLLTDGWLYAPSHLGPFNPCSKEIDQ